MTLARHPFFRVNITVDRVSGAVVINPTLDVVQSAINDMCRTVLGSVKTVWDWGQLGLPLLSPTATSGLSSTKHLNTRPRMSFFPAIARDVEITRSVLLLTGAAYGVSTAATEYMAMLQQRFQWLWKDDPSVTFAVRGSDA